MKALKFTILSILILGLISCEKIEFKKDISGIWQFDGEGGGIASGGWYKTNTFSHLRLTKKGRYSLYNSDTLKASGEYSIYESNSDQTFFEPYYINLKADQNQRIGFPFNRDLDVTIINNDTLLFSERNVIEGLVYYFTRK